MMPDQLSGKTWIYIAVVILFGTSIKCEFVDSLPQSPQYDSQATTTLFLQEFNREASEMCNRVSNMEWRYTTNTTTFNKRRMREQQSIAAKFECISWRRAHNINSTASIDPNLQRQFDRILKPGHCGLGEVKFMELNHVLTVMKDNYDNAKICPYTEQILTANLHNGKTVKEYPDHANYVSATTTYCDLKLDSSILRIMQQSRVEKELCHTWKAWRDVTGPPVRNTFMRYVDLANQAAKTHGFKNAGDQMRAAYDDPDLFFTVQDLWFLIQPLYKQLFTYIRKGLVQYYGKHLIRKDGPIPAHLLGDLWSMNWKNILEIVYPGPIEMSAIDQVMIKQGYTPLKMYQSAEEFYTSLGLPPLLPEFWRNSLLQKPNEIFMQCKSAAWDFCNNVDFRVNHCTQVRLEDYITAHKQLGYIQYFMHYSQKPFIFRNGPNPAFKEAVAQAIGLCVSGPVHLQKVNLFPSSVDTDSGNSKTNIEFLLTMALQKLPLMAFSLVLEKWRWHVFEKGPSNMNARWWELHLRYMGVTPPTSRSNDHFDAGAKYEVISDHDHLKHFIATILQFQIFAELCQASNHVGSLHTCDFYRSRSAGRILSEIMQHGAILNSKQLIKLLTRGQTDKLSVEPLLEYFRPLEAWLEIQNRDEIVTGWNSNMEDVSLYQPIHSTSREISPFQSINFIVYAMCYVLLFCF